MNELIPITIMVRPVAIIIGLSFVMMFLAPIASHFLFGAKKAIEAGTRSINDEYFKLYPGLVDVRKTDVYDVVWSDPEGF